MVTLGDMLRGRVKDAMNAIQDTVAEVERRGGLEGLAGQVADRLREEEARLQSGRSFLHPEYQQKVRLWYARLELPPGASVEEIRKQFRALMRLYHPDRFAGSKESEALATQLAQELTVAYEGLLEHHRAGPGKD